MESKDPFIAEYDPYSKTRPLKQWRPRSTQPWTISLFLAATGICFGLLLAISLIEKEPTTITKREIYSNGNGHHQRRAVLERREAACAAVAVVTVEVCSPLSGYACPPTATTEPTTTFTQPCVTTVFTTVTGSYMVLTSQTPTTQCTATVTESVTVCSPLSGYRCPSATPTVAAATTASTGSCSTSTSTTTITDTGLYVPSTTQCTVTVIEAVTVCFSRSGYACPTAKPSTAAAAASMGSCSTETVTATLVETATAYLVLTTQSPVTQCTSYVTESVTLCLPLSGQVCPSATSTTTTAIASRGSCRTSTATETLTVTGSYLVLTTQNPTTQCTAYATETVVVCTPRSGYTCPTTTPTTAYAAAASTGSCSTRTATVTLVQSPYFSLKSQPPTLTLVSTPYFSLSNQDTISKTSSTSAPVTTPSTLHSESPTPQQTTSSSASQIIPEYTSSPLQGTTPIVTTTESTYIFSTAQVTTTTLQFATSPTGTGFSGYSYTVSSTVSETIYYSDSVYMSLATQSSTSSFAETSYGTTSSGSSPPTLQDTELSSSTSPSQSTSTLEYTTTALAPFANPTTQEFQTPSTLSAFVPLVSLTTQAMYTTTLADSTDTLSLSLGEYTMVTTDGATYFFVASTNGIHASLYTGSQDSASSTTGSISSVGLTSAQPTPTSGNFTLDQNLVLIKLQPFHPYYYFFALYLPKIIAVIMISLWTIIFAGLKLMEPFYQLSASTGAFAGESMFGNYLASQTSLASLSAMFSGQWVLLLGGSVLVTWMAIVALVSESMIVVSEGFCTNLNDPGAKPYPCDPGWAVNEPILKALLALTGAAFVLTFILILILSRRRRTGVYHDPSSIAAMAELLGNPLVMEDLQAIKPSSSDREVKLLLGENRYRIGLYDPFTGEDALSSLSQQHELRWGLIKLDRMSLAQTINNRRLAGYNAVPNPSIVSTEEHKANRKRRIFQLVYDIVMLLTAMCVFGLVLGYWLDGKHDPLNDFFNSNTFGSRFLLTCLSLILSAGWRSISQETTVMAPYRAMARAYEAQSGVEATKSILAPTAHTVWTALYKGLRLRYYMVTMVAMCAVLADLLLIAVSGVPYRTDQLVLSLKISVFASLSILGIMILTSISVIIFRKTSAGGTRKLPRSPNTLAGVWLYLCHGKLANQGAGNTGDFSSPLDADGLVAKYEGYRYGFTRKLGTDMVGRWTIDTVLDLRNWTLPANQYHQYHSQPNENLEQRGPQPFEASATPVEGPCNQSRQDPFIHRAGSRRLTHTSPYGIPYFEAQAKSPIAQAPPARFEELRPRPRTQPQPPIIRLTPKPLQVVSTPHVPPPRRQQTVPTPQIPISQVPPVPPVRRQQTVPTPQEALAEWEYEQEFHDPRRMSAGSVYSENRWTNDGRSQYRYG